jgi:hypothetical protein
MGIPIDIANRRFDGNSMPEKLTFETDSPAFTPILNCANKLVVNPTIIMMLKSKCFIE